MKAQLNHYGKMALEHLREFRPKQYKRLKTSGKLDKHLMQAQTKTVDEIANLMTNHDLQKFEAEEIVLPKYILTTPESMKEEEETPRSEAYEAIKGLIEIHRIMDEDN